MFGLLRPPRHGVPEAARTAFRAHYCTGCHALAAHGGTSASLFTSYDQAFALLTVTSLGSAETATARRPCTAMPFRSVDVRVLPRATARAVASLGLCLADAKLADDQADDGRWWTPLVRRLYRGRVARAWRMLDRAGFAGGALRALPERQAAAEARAGPTLEELAAPTAAVTGAVFAFLARLAGRPDLTLCMTALGTDLGRLVYATDAWVDRAADRANSRFNAVDACGAGDVPAWIAARLEAVRGHLDGLPLGAAREALDAALDGLALRVPSVPCRHQRGARYRQAGDCDICIGFECLDGCVGGCDCAGCFCDVPCELFSSKRDEALKERIRKRRQERYERRKERLDDRIKRREERRIRKRQ